MRCVDAFSTPRLAAERIRFPHYSRWLDLFRNPDVTAFEGGAWAFERIARGFAKQLGRWETAGIGYWIFAERGRFVGIGGVRDLPRAGPLAVELGYALVPEFWGKGLATEMARGVLDSGVDGLGSRDVIAYTLLAHGASRRVLEKSGFHFEGERWQEGRPHALYRRRA